MAEYAPLQYDDEEQQLQLRLPSRHQHCPPPPLSVAGIPKSSRVASLDVFRGLCVFLMMLVDYGGPIFPIIAHAPWDGLHLADFVMPFFLFIAGVSLAIAYKVLLGGEKVIDRVDTTKKTVVRAVKLFLLGVFLQGGYLHGTKSFTYGVDILGIRWMGILQTYDLPFLICYGLFYLCMLRISVAYIVAALCEIWLPCQKRKFGMGRSYFWQWCVIFCFCTTYLGLLYGLHVPDWEFSTSNLGSSLPTSEITRVHKVKCGLRGDLGPACNSAGMIDRAVLGINHLYARPAYGNLKVCNKSKYGRILENSPSWCHAPFDPEGILGSLTAAVTCIIGLQFGHILVQIQDHKERLLRWSVLSLFLFVLGVFLVFLGVPVNKSLYTVSYTLLTSATGGFAFCALYLLVDLWGYKRWLFVLEWMGVHALGIFILLTSNILVIFLQGFYWKSPENNLIKWVISCFIHQ